MKQKKEFSVVYIITKLELGGAQKVCLSLFDGIEQGGIKSFLISGSEGTLTNRVAHKQNTILLKSLKREIFKPWLEIKNFVSLVKEIKKIRKQNHNLIVHTHSTKAGIIGRWAAKFAGVKNIVHTVHGYGFHSHQKKTSWLAVYLIEFFTSLITSHFVCVSSQDVKLGIRLFPWFEKKHSIIRAAVEWEKFKTPACSTTPFPKQEEPFVFGTVACFKPQKNLLDLFKAFEATIQKNPNVLLEVIGDGEMRKDIEKWIDEKKLKSKIILHGWKKDIVPIMKRWHAFTLTSLWEGLPCAIVEARLLYLPILAYDTGGIRDIITSMKNGILLKQKDWKSLAKNMLAISTSSGLHNSLQKHKDNLEDFKNENMIENHIDLYRELGSF